MKKLFSIILILAAVVITSCEGPMGVPGEDGDTIIGSVFEIEGDFKASNEYKLYFEFPQNFEIFETDVVLVYILWDVVQTNGGTLDVWRLLPQTVVLPEGIIQYNFDYTVNDVQIFMEGTIPPRDWLPAETNNQVFRIAVLPADFLAKKSIDISDFNSLKSLPGLKLDTVGKVEIK